MKRIVSMFLMVSLIVCMFAGCGGNGNCSTSQTDDSQSSSASASDTGTTDDEEPYTLYFAYQVSKEGPNQQKVNEAVSELTIEALNIDVQLVPLTAGTYNTQMPMMLAANEPLDVFMTSSVYVPQYIDSQYIRDLDDYIDSLDGALEQLGDTYEAGYVGDFLAGLPTLKEQAVPSALICRKDIMDELGYTAEDFNIVDEEDYQQITDLYAEVHEKYPDMNCLDGTYIMGLEPFCFTDCLSTDNGMGVLETPDTTTVTNWFESDQFQFFCELAREWFLAGYSSPDIAVNQDGGGVKMRAGNCFSFVESYKPNTYVEKESQTGYAVEVIRLGTVPKNTNAVSNRLYCIANASEDPAKAAEFLNFAFTNGEFIDLINWGIEGEDWVKNEDGMAAYPEGVDANSVAYHNDYGFAYPSQYLGTPWEGNPTDIWEQYQTFNEELPVSPAFGFTFDSRDVSTELAQCTSVYEEYSKDLAFGTVEIEPRLKEFNDALYAAGLQTIIDEKQTQLDAWLAEQE